MMDWLATPLSASAQHQLEPWAYWHARLMVLGWSVLIPLGVLVARYFKVTPQQGWPQQLDNKVWWHAHRSAQWAGMLVVSIGAWLAWGHTVGGGSAARLHAWGGWALLALGWLQIASGLGRGSKGGPTDNTLRGDHYDMTPHRVRFERLHKSLGWLCVLAALVVTALGLYVADAPRWMALLLAAWWLLLAVAARQLQRKGRCVDTYQAIWGPDPQHPGNRVKPIGWGVRRHQS
jgi:hypothetical protein